MSIAVTISGDGTTVKNINYEAKHVTFRDPKTGLPTTRILDITSAPNHTSESQLKGWQSVVHGVVQSFNTSPLGLDNPLDEDEFISFVKGIGTDHANDQKKLVRLCEMWTTNSHKTLLGKRYLSDHSLQEYLPDIMRFNEEKIAAAGGIDAWNSLGEAEQNKRDLAMCHQLWTYFGEREWADLSPSDRFEKESLVWCGCCMHKEMNSVKGGVQGMKLFWESIGGPEPVKLMNKANDAAVAKSQKGSTVSENALEVSEGGAVKLTSLVGE